MFTKLIKLTGILVFTLSTLSASAANIEIDNDENDCFAGWISMDVTVMVDGEGFSFDPSCRFGFNEQIATKSGLTCRVEAGMCSNFSPRNKFEVHCSDGSVKRVDISCYE